MKARFAAVLAMLAVCALLAAGGVAAVPCSAQPVAVLQEKCIVAAEATEQDIAALFDTWNQALRSGDPEKVADLYAERSILLPTLSNTPRLTRAEKVDYFRHFLEHRPSGEIVMRQISIGADIAVDTGLYTFHYATTGESVRARYSFTYGWDGDGWRIVSHHSSVMPEK